jgi:hypothetical protein
MYVCMNLQGWEETVDASIGFAITSSLARNNKEASNSFIKTNLDVSTVYDFTYICVCMYVSLCIY